MVKEKDTELKNIEQTERTEIARKVTLYLDDQLEELEKNYPDHMRNFYSGMTSNRGPATAPSKINELEKYVRDAFDPGRRLTIENLNAVIEEALKFGGKMAANNKSSTISDDNTFRVALFVYNSMGNKKPFDISGKEFEGLNLKNFPHKIPLTANNTENIDPNNVKNLTTFIQCQLPDHLDYNNFLITKFDNCKGIDNIALRKTRENVVKHANGSNKLAKIIKEEFLVQEIGAVKLEDYKLDKAGFTNALEQGVEKYNEALGHLRDSITHKKSNTVIEEGDFNKLFRDYDTRDASEKSAEKVIKTTLKKFDSADLVQTVQDSINLVEQRRQKEALTAIIKGRDTVKSKDFNQNSNVSKFQGTLEVLTHYSKASDGKLKFNDLPELIANELENNGKSFNPGLVNLAIKKSGILNSETAIAAATVLELDKLKSHSSIKNHLTLSEPEKNLSIGGIYALRAIQQASGEIRSSEEAGKFLDKMLQNGFITTKDREQMKCEDKKLTIGKTTVIDFSRYRANYSGPYEGI